MHRLAQDVLTNDGTKRRLTVSTAREWGSTRPFELHVATLAVLVHNLTEQHGPTVTESGYEMPELMPCVSQ